MNKLFKLLLIALTASTSVVAGDAAPKSPFDGAKAEAGTPVAIKFGHFRKKAA